MDSTGDQARRMVGQETEAGLVPPSADRRALHLHRRRIRLWQRPSAGAGGGERPWPLQLWRALLQPLLTREISGPGRVINDYYWGYHESTFTALLIFPLGTAAVDRPLPGALERPRHQRKGDPLSSSSNRPGLRRSESMPAPHLAEHPLPYTESPAEGYRLRQRHKSRTALTPVWATIVRSEWLGEDRSDG